MAKGFTRDSLSQSDTSIPEEHMFRHSPSYDLSSTYLSIGGGGGGGGGRGVERGFDWF